MPRYRADSLIKTMILNRCRRQRMGLAVCSAKLFASVIESILAKVRNAEKQPTPRRRDRGGLRVLRVSLRRVVAGSSRSELDLSPGRDRLIRGTGHELSVSGDPGRDGVGRHDLALQVEHDAGGQGSGPESHDADNLRWYYLECGQPTVDDVQPGEDGQDDEHRLTRTWNRGRSGVAHELVP